MITTNAFGSRPSDDQWARDVAPAELVGAAVLAAQAYLRHDLREVFALARDHDARTLVFGLLNLVIPLGEMVFNSAAEMDRWLLDRIADLERGDGPRAA